MPAGPTRGDYLDASMFNEVDRARFWAKVERRGPYECWPWRGCRSHAYGMAFVRALKRPTNAHRVAYALTNGPVPAGLVVRHRCPDGENRMCVNPAHLEIGTQKENIRDFIYSDRERVLTALKIRSRYNAGEKVRDIARSLGLPYDQVRHLARNLTLVDPDYAPRVADRAGDLNAKLTGEQVVDVRARHAKGESAAKLAREFDVAFSTMCDALNGATWRHLPLTERPGRVRHGGHPGEDHPNAKLTNAAVMAMRERYAEGESSCALAEDFGISAANVHKIVTGHRWKHLPTIPRQHAA